MVFADWLMAGGYFGLLISAIIGISWMCRDRPWRG